MLELFGMFVLALLPIIWLVAALCGLHMEAYKASVGALVVAFACAMLGWQMPLVNATTAALEGFAMALWPIVIVIIAAVFTYNLTVHTGAMEKIKAMLCSVSSDMRVLVILIGWCFGNFLEGMAGFGTAVAIPAKTAMKPELVPWMLSRPEPTGPKRWIWISVEIPETNSDIPATWHVNSGVAPHIPHRISAGVTIGRLASHSRFSDCSAVPWTMPCTST